MDELKTGSRGPVVQLLQLGLERAGYLPAPPTAASAPPLKPPCANSKRRRGCPPPASPIPPPGSR